MWLIIIIPALLALFFAVTFAEYRKAFSVRGKEATGFFEYFFSCFPELVREDFSCVSGEERLFGIRVRYDGAQKGLIVMIHGYGFNLERYLPQAEYLAKAGYTIVLFDGTGIGRSSGATIRGLPQHLVDSCAVLDYVLSCPELSGLPLLLYGHSWGGFAANAVSGLPAATGGRRRPSVDGQPEHSWGGFAANAVSGLPAATGGRRRPSVDGQSGPRQHRHCERSEAIQEALKKRYPARGVLSVAGYYDSLGAMRASIRARYGAPGRAVMFPIAFYQRMAFGRAAGRTSVRGLKAADCPAFLIHSKDDPILPFEDNFVKIKKALAGRKDTFFREVDGGNHNLGVPAGVDRQIRDLQKRLGEDAGGGEPQRELWRLQMKLDENIMKSFLDFFDNCIDTVSAGILT